MCSLTEILDLCERADNSFLLIFKNSIQLMVHYVGVSTEILYFELINIKRSGTIAVRHRFMFKFH